MPTEWQASQFPKHLKKKLSVIFDGVDTEFFKPNTTLDFTNSSVTINGEYASASIGPEELLLSYATRGMEPLRGFPEFMRTLPSLLEDLPHLKVIVGGRDRSAYGPQAPSHQGSWLKKTLDELPVLKDHPRVIFTGLMSYENYRLMLYRTNLHCYFTKPYVTSWSLFEAVASGTNILTNESPATTGTIPIPPENTVANIESINSKKGIKKIKNLLSIVSRNRDEIEAHYTKKFACARWEELINNCLRNSQHKHY